MLQWAKINCKCTRAASVHKNELPVYSVHKYNLSVHKSCLSAQCTKINCQYTKVALVTCWKMPGYMVFRPISPLLLNCTVGTSCRCHLPCKSIRHQEDILIPHGKACFVLAVALKCKFPFHFAQFVREPKKY